MKHHSVTYRYVVAYNSWISIASIGFFVVGDVNHTQVLNINAVPDFDIVNVASYDAAKPDGAIFAARYVANDVGGWSYPAVVAKSG